MRLQTANAGKMGFQKAKKHKNEVKLVSKEELLNEMGKVRTRIKENAEQNEGIDERLAVNMRHLVTREGRVIEKFQESQEVWEGNRNLLSSQCGRSNPLFSRCDEFRQRKEQIAAIETTKSDQEKYSNRFWYLRLRSYESSQLHSKGFDLITALKHREVSKYESNYVNRFISDREGERLDEQHALSDIFSGFMTKVVDNPHKHIEVIRKPESQQNGRLYSQ